MSHLGPRSLRQILDGGFDVIRFRPGVVGWSALVLVGPLVALPMIVGLLQLLDRPLSDEELVFASGPFSGFEEGPFAEWMDVWGWAMSSLASTLLAVAVGHLVAAWLAGVDPTVGATLAAVMRRLPVVLVAWTVVTLTKSTIALCGLGLLLVPLWAMLGPVLGAESVGPLVALRRTAALGRRNWGRIAALSVSFAVVGFFANLAAWWLPLTIGPLLGLDLERSAYLMVGLGILVSMVMSAALASATALAYVDARVRGEGLDIELRLNEVLSR